MGEQSGAQHTSDNTKTPFAVDTQQLNLPMGSDSKSVQVRPRRVPNTAGLRAGSAAWAQAWRAPMRSQPRNGIAPPGSKPALTHRLPLATVLGKRWPCGTFGRHAPHLIQRRPAQLACFSGVERPCCPRRLPRAHCRFELFMMDRARPGKDHTGDNVAQKAKDPHPPARPMWEFTNMDMTVFQTISASTSPAGHGETTGINDFTTLLDPGFMSLGRTPSSME